MAENSLPVATEWRRLHPLSPVVRFGRIALAFLVAVVPSLELEGRRRQGAGAQVSPVPPLLIWVVLLAISAVAGVISWLVTRWRINGSDLQIETGVLRRQSLRIPLARIQAVDVLQPLSARVLGLAEVRVVSAGRGGERGRLAYLTLEQAGAVRAQLLALAHGLAPETPEPMAQPLFRVDNLRLVIALSMRASIFVPVAIVVGAVVTVIVSPRVGAAVISSTLTGLIAVVVHVARTFNEEFDFVISEAGDGMRLDRGLLQKRHETIPLGRIQAVRVVQPLLWRPMGWLRLEVDVARQHGARQGREDPQQVARTLLPVGGSVETLALLGRVFPETGMAPPPRARPPARAWLKAPLSYHFLAAWYGGRYVYARTGRVQAATVVVPLHKVQSARYRQGPLQRALRLASVHVDTAGHRWSADARCRDATEAEQMLWDITGRAQRSRALKVPAIAGALR